MSPSVSIKAKEIIADIRSGMNNRQLMDKYQISRTNLRYIFRMLLDANAIEQSELKPLVPILREESDIGNRRGVERCYVFISLPIHDVKNPRNKGRVVDITEKGLQISGIPANEGDIVEFVVSTDYFPDVSPFELEARCHWASTEEVGKLYSGFEITSISKGDLGQLRKIIRTLTVLDAKVNIR